MDIDNHCGMCMTNRNLDKTTNMGQDAIDVKKVAVLNLISDNDESSCQSIKDDEESMGRKRSPTVVLVAEPEFAPSSKCHSIPSSPGSNSPKRVCVRHDYHDHAFERDPEALSELMTSGHFSYDGTHDDDESHLDMEANDASKKRRGPRGGVAVPFPEKLYIMLSGVEEDGNAHIVSWQPHGRCFVVHKPKQFVSEVMPKYFRQTKLTSFQRQLNLYGFSRLTSGRDRGGYYHELFLRGRLFLCKRMMRTRIKGTGIKAASNPSSEPDFYCMPHIEEIREDHQVPPVPWISINDVSEDTTPDQIKSGMKVVNETQLLSAADNFVFPPLPLLMTMGEGCLVTPPNTPPQQARVQAPTEFPSEIMLACDSSSSLLQPDDEVVFEGKTFHYLDSFSLDGILDKGHTVVRERDEMNFLAGYDEYMSYEAMGEIAIV